MQHDPKMVEMVARAMRERRSPPRDFIELTTAALDAVAAAGRLVPEGWQALSEREVLQQAAQIMRARGEGGVAVMLEDAARQMVLDALRARLAGEEGK